jgi:hypothetical protein
VFLHVVLNQEKGKDDGRKSPPHPTVLKQQILKNNKKIGKKESERFISLDS